MSQSSLGTAIDRGPFIVSRAKSVEIARSYICSIIISVARLGVIMYQAAVIDLGLSAMISVSNFF